MFEQQLVLYRFMLGYCQQLSADIEESKMTHQPSPGLKPPIWILTHLAISTDYAARCLGLPAACPKEWHRAFGPGSQNLPDLQPLPTKKELLDAIEAGHARVSEAAQNASPEKMAEPNPIELLKDTPLKTVGDLVCHLLSTHEAFHLGQLSAWRREAGFPPII